MMMEESSPVKSMVSELAGKMKTPSLPLEMNLERNPHEDSPPSSLHSDSQICSENKKEKPVIAPQPSAKPKIKSSPLIEKLQANLTLTPTALLPSVKSPDPKQQPLPFCLISPCGPRSPTLRPTQHTGAHEVPVSFEQPAEGNRLPNFNKSRVRLTFNRRPPTRQHRRSSGEEVTSVTHDDATPPSPCDQCNPENSSDKNSDAEQVLSSHLEDAEMQLSEDSTQTLEQETAEQEGHLNIKQDNEGTENNNKEEAGELAEEELSDRHPAADSVEIQIPEEKQHEEQSSEEMDGLEEQGESTVAEGNDELQVQASEG